MYLIVPSLRLNLQNTREFDKNPEDYMYNLCLNIIHLDNE